MRRPRPGRVVAWLVVGWVLVALAWTLAVHRTPGRFTSTAVVSTVPGDRGCHAVGEWTSDDGRTVRHGVRLDGQCLRPGSSRDATHDTALGPWPTPGGDDVVHERGAPVVAVLVSVVLLVMAGTGLVVTDP